MKRHVVSIMIVVSLLASLVMTACGPETAPKGPVKIVYWRSLSGAPGNAQEELVKRFNDSQKDVEVEAQFQGSYPELVRKLQAAIAAGALPDVVLLDSPYVAFFAKNGTLLALDELVKGKDGIDLKDYVPGLLQDGYYQGKLYAIPFARSTPILYYNRDMFKAAGLPDRPPDTWNEFLEFSRKLTKVEGGQIKQIGYAVQMGTTTAHWYFQGMVYAFGGEVSDDKYNVLIDKPEAVQAAKFLYDLVNTHQVAIPGTGPDGAQGEFTNGRSGMHFGSTGSLVNIVKTAKFSVGVGFMPAQVRRQVPVGGSTLSIIAKSPKDKQRAALQFIKYMTGKESNVYWVQQTGYMPISTSAKGDPQLQDFMAKNPLFKVAVDQLQYVRPQASIISVPKATEIMRALVEELTVGKVDPTQACKKAAEELRKEYNETFK